MTNWTFYVGSNNEAASLTWSPNGTLRQLAITDGFNSGGTQTCNFGTSSVMGYDDIGRLLSDNCGPVWSQTFSYDQYDNITKSGSISWACASCYNANTNHYNSTLSPLISYDNNGALLTDTFHTYTWNAYGKLSTVDSSACGTNGQCVTYDALGHAVEIGNGTTYTEIWYTQLGKTAYMSGSKLSYAYWPAPGGGTLLQLHSPSDNYYFEHKDWLGSARISSGLLGAIIDDRAFAPYGEMYQNFGSTSANELMFTGDAQDIVAGTYETPNRELNPNQGRWLSPDPAGAGWNLYSYSTNPNGLIDPSGLMLCLASRPTGPHSAVGGTGGCNGLGFDNGTGSGVPSPVDAGASVGCSDCSGNGATNTQSAGSGNQNGASGSVGADGNSGGNPVVTATIWVNTADNDWLFSTDHGQTWDTPIYGWPGMVGATFLDFVNAMFQDTSVDTSTSVQIGFIEGDGNQGYIDANPGVGVSISQTVEGPTPDQTVLFNVSGSAGTNSVGTSIVQNPDGTISSQGTTFSTGYGVTLLGPWQVQVPFSPSIPQDPYSGPYRLSTSGGFIDINPDSCYCLP